jgi:hypothetical protein
MSDGVLSGKFKAGDTVVIDLIEGNLDFTPQPRADAPQAEPQVMLATPA